MLKTTRGVLVLLTLINLFNYLDRYILVALSPAIKKELGLNDLQIGALGSAFMFSYFLVSPFFGWLGDRKPRLKLMSLGVGVWSLATVVSGLGRNTWQLFGARLFVGVGEAAYGSISPSVLRDLFPRSVIGRIFSIFFMAIPVGSALGFVLGGMLEKAVGWRSAFFVAGVPGVFLALALLLIREPKRGTFDEAEYQEAASPIRETLAELWANSTYVLTVAGYCAYTFVVGGIAFWIPHYIERYLGVAASDGDMAFGAITVVAGLLGTVIGGAWADRWAKRGADAYLKLSALSMFAALPVYFLVLEVRSFKVFCVSTFVLEFLLFLSTSPVNAEIINCVSPRIRSIANAAAIFAIHLFGDLFSPSLIGAISDRANLYSGMQLFSLMIFVSGMVWAWKVVNEWAVLPWPENALVLPPSQCHRGLHVSEQENTLEAFRAAAKAGAPMVELDVRLSRDGVAVVIHDDSLRRVSGVEGLVKELTAGELFAKARAPSLRAVLEDPECASLKVNVELKHCPGQNGALAMAVAKAVTGFEKRVLFSSFNPLLLRSVSQLLPDVPRALLATEERDPGNKIYLRRMWMAFLARPHMLNFDGRFFSEALARRLAGRQVPVAIWTVETSAEAKKFLAMGAKSIISPLPKPL